MSERSVTVRLRAEIGDFKAKMDQASRAALQVGDAAVRGNQKAAGQLAAQQAAAKNSAEAWDGLKSAATVGGTAMVAGFALATRATMNFDKQMSAVKAATHATAAEMDQLTSAAMEAGARTQYSATEAAGAIEALSKAGQSTADILGGGLDGALDLAAAGSLDVSQAAEIAATTITQFGLKGADMAHVADLLAAGAGKAQGNVQDLALALQYVGTTASQMGVSVEQTTGTLAYLASNGQLAEKAGTGLRGVLSALTAPSQQAQSAMDQYGISLYDAQGKFVGLDGVAGQLQGSLSGLTEEQRNVALGQIFGNAQIETARILYKGGAGAITEWTGKVNDQGYAAETAAMKMDNLAGDVEKLTGSLETAFISGGSGSTGALRFFVQTAEAMVDTVGQLPGPLLGVSVAMLGLGGAALLLTPRLLAARVALQEIGTASPKAASALTAVGKAAGMYVALLMAATAANEFGSAAGAAASDASTMATSLTRLADGTGDIKDFGNEFNVLAHVLRGGIAIEALGGMSTGLAGIADDASGATGGLRGFALSTNDMLSGLIGMQSPLDDSKAAIKNIDDGLAQMVSSGNSEKAAMALEKLKQEVASGGGDVDAFVGSLQGYKAAVESSQSESDAAAASIKSVGAAAAAAGDDMDAFAKGLEAVLAPGLALERATTAQIDGLRELSSAAKENGTSLSAQTEKGRANREVFASMIEKNRDLAIAVGRVKEAQEGTAAGSDAAKAKYAEVSEALVRAGVKAGFSEGAMRKFLQSMNAVDGAKVDPKITANVSVLKANLSDAKARLAHLRTLKTSPKVEADIRAAKRDVRAAQAALNNFRQRGKPGVGVNNDPANAGIQAAIGWGENWAGKTFWATLKTKAFLGGAVGAARGGRIGYDSGGPVFGAGTKTSDSIPAWLSNGEYVIQAKSVDKYGAEFFDRVNAGRYAHGGPIARKTYKNKKDYDKALKAWNARDKTFQDANSARNDRIATRDSAATSRTSAVESTRSNFRGNSGVMTFDFAAYESARSNTVSAIKEEADALDGLFDARKKANSANKADRPAALRELAEAQRKYADASRAAADASEAEAKAKPTSANILTNFRDRVTKMQGFAGNLRTLASWGMPTILLAEILNSGLESGSQMAAALVEGGAGNISEFQSLAALQTFVGTDLGNLNAAWNPGEGDLTLDQQLGNANTAIGPAPKGPGVKPKYKKKRSAKRRALGGPVRAGEPYLVGEREAEMFVPGMSGTIVPRHQLQKAMAVGAGGGGGGEFVISGPVQINLDGQGVWNGMLTANRRTGFTLRPLDGSS